MEKSNGSSSGEKTSFNQEVAKQEIAEVLEKIRLHGPDRVVIDDNGSATNSRRAREVYGIEPSNIFVRNDGWTLACTDDHIRVAYDLWEDQWTHIIIQSGDVLRIKDFLYLMEHMQNNH